MMEVNKSTFHTGSYNWTQLAVSLY